MGFFGTVIGALISTVFIIYITEINPDMMFILAALPFIVLTILAAYGAAKNPARYENQAVLRKKMKSSNSEPKPEPQTQVEEVPEWKLEAERIKKQMLLDSYEERAKIIRRTEEKAILEKQRMAREQEKISEDKD